MRLFVYVLGVAFGVIFLSMNYVSTTSAVTQAEIVGSQIKPVCSFGLVEVNTPVTAGAWQIADVETGEVLAEYQPTTIFPFASVVKLLTAQAIVEEVDSINTVVTLTTEDILTEGRSGGLEVGEEYSAYGLLSPLLLTSSNDAGVALSRAYPNIVEIVNDFVLKAGAVDTIIVDTTGLGIHNRTTAADLSRVIRSLYEESLHIFDITRTSQIISHYGNGWVNNIPFRKLEGFAGGKQGYLPEAKQTGVAVFTIGEASPKTFSISILYSDSVAKDMEMLHQAVTASYACVGDKEAVL